MEEQEKKLSRFSKLAAWTEYELADLCLGLTPDRGRADNEERNEVLESIHRAAEMGELPRKTNSLLPFNLNQYRTGTYYPRSDATRWAAANFPETFPFMNAERLPDAFRALQVDRDAARAELETAQKLNAPGKRSEKTHLNIIGGLLALMLGKSPAGKPQSSFENQGAIISAMLGHYGHIKGMGDSNLEKIMADANKTLKDSAISGG